MQIVPLPQRQFRGLGARSGNSSSTISQTGRADRTTGWRNQFRNYVASAVAPTDAQVAPEKPTLDELMTNPLSSFEKAFESETVPFFNKLKRGIQPTDTVFSDKALTYFSSTPPTSPEDASHVNALARARSWLYTT
jgi:hypothetical protein